MHTVFFADSGWSCTWRKSVTVPHGAMVGVASKFMFFFFPDLWPCSLLEECCSTKVCSRRAEWKPVYKYQNRFPPTHTHHTQTQTHHAPHIYSIDFLSRNSFQLESLWSTSMARRWWKEPFTATLSTEFSGLLTIIQGEDSERLLRLRSWKKLMLGGILQQCFAL